MTGSFLHQDPIDLERFLVQQARSDRAPRAVLQRTMVGLTSASLGLSLAGGTKLAWATSAAGKVTPWLIAKYVAVGMGATLATLAGAEQLQQVFDASQTSLGESTPPQPDAVRGHPLNAASVMASPAAPRTAAPPVVASRAALGSPSAALTPLEADVPPASRADLPSSTEFDSAGAAGSPAALAREVARLRSVRASLVAGAPRAALQALDRYAVEFPAGALRAEASALRVEAVAMLGDKALVRRLTADFLTKFPSSPLVDRVRAMSDVAGEGESKP